MYQVSLNSQVRKALLALQVESVLLDKLELQDHVEIQDKKAIQDLRVLQDFPEFRDFQV